MMYLSVDIGGTRLRAALIGEDGTIHSRRRINTRASEGAEAVLSDLKSMCDSIFRDNLHAVVAIGISFGGPVDYPNQTILRSQHVSGWDKLGLSKMLADRFGVPAVMDNDGNVAALGEKVYGAGIAVSSLVYLTVSTGVGGGIILDGQVVRGRSNLAGEIGHIIVEPDGRACSCGKHGCVEAYASGDSLAAIAKERVTADVQAGAAILREAGEGHIDSAAVFRAARGGDSLASSLVSVSVGALARGIASVVTIIDTELVVIGGGVSFEGAFLFEPLRRQVSEQAMFGEAYPVPIVPAELDDDVGLLGAAALARSVFGRQE
jgi:glucokinase